MPKLKYQPQFQPLANFFKGLLSICQQRPHTFAQKYKEKFKTSYTTLYQVTYAQAAPNNTTLRRFANAFAEELAWCAKIGAIDLITDLGTIADLAMPGLEINLNDRSLSDALYETFALLYPGDSEDAIESDFDLSHMHDSQSSLKLILQHWRRLTEADRLTALPIILRDTTQAIENFHLELDSSGLADRLAISIRSTMEEWGVSTIDRFADRVLEEYEVKEGQRSKIKGSIVTAVRSIVELKQIPETQDPAFSGAMGYLAGVLESEVFNGDVVAMLTFFATPKRAAVGK